MKLTNDTVFKAAWLLGRVPPHALSATVFVKGTFKMRPGGEATAAEEQAELSGDVHVDDDPARRLLVASDFALHKPRTDLLLKGTCHAPGGKPTEVCRVSFKVGAWSKALGVIGDRTWKKSLFGASMSAPQPFASMPLTWERSFGGAGFPRNPDGRGVAEIEGPDGTPMHPLPNIEDPSALVKGASARPEPAGFGPVSLGWPQRRSKAGTFGAAWLREKWPWFPDDADWTLFNAAPEDQQLAGYLRGDETVVVENLHPAHARYETRLPRLRVRWFIDEDAGDKLHFHEIPLRLDTLSVDMDAELLVLTWRGVAPVRSKKMKEILEHYVVAEPLDSAPLSSADYHARLEARKREMEEAKAKRPVPFVPLELPDIAPPDLGWVKKAEAEKAALESEMRGLETKQAARRKALSAKLSELGVPMPAPGAGGADPFQAAHASYERLKARDPQAAALFPAPKKADFEFPPMTPFPAPPPEPAPRPKWTRAACAAHAAARGSFAGQDLSELDLSGIDFSELDLQGAVLAGSTLTGCRFARSILTRAALRKAQLAGAVLEGATLEGADLAGAVLGGAVLRGATLANADLTGAVLEGADLTEARAGRALFLGADLSGVKAAGADLRGAQLDGATVTSAEFTRARLDGASFEKSTGAGLVLSQSTLTKARFSGAKLPQAVVRNASARESVWEGAVLTQADFSFCDLSRAMFESAVLEGAFLVAANLRRARLPDADLRGADLTGANLFRGTLESANLRGARLNGANLFEAELYQALAADCDFSSANLKGTKLA